MKSYLTKHRKKVLEELGFLPPNEVVESINVTLQGYDGYHKEYIGEGAHERYEKDRQVLIEEGVLK
jgi:hypothetical protein